MVWRVRQISGSYQTCGVADNDFQISLSVLFLNLPLAAAQRVPKRASHLSYRVKLKSPLNLVLSNYFS